MWKLFWRLYKRWLLVCGGLILVALGVFFVYFHFQYPALRHDNIDAAFDELESTIRDNQKYIDQPGKLPRDKRLPRDMDFDLALRTVQRVRRLMDSGQLKYRDFAQLRYLNQLPLERRPMGREYNRLFVEINRLLDEQQAGPSEGPGEAAGDGALTGPGERPDSREGEPNQLGTERND